MNRLVPCLLSTLVLAACGPASDPVGPTGDQPALAASQFTANTRDPLDTYVYIPCAAGGSGESVHLTGSLHQLFHITLSSSGKFVLKEHFQPQGVSGVGETTGIKYQGTGVTQSLFRSGEVGLSYTFVNNFRIIGRGRGNNYLIHETFHLTVNANGTLTTAVAGFKAACR